MFTGNGKKAKKDPTKGDIAKAVEANQKAAQQAAFGIQKMLMNMAQNMQNLAQRFATLETKYDNLTYYTLAIGNVLGAKDELLKTAIKDESKKLRRLDFERASKEDDVKRNLNEPAEGYQIKNGDIVTMEVWASDPTTNELFDDLCLFRSKVDVGKGELKFIEDQLIGLKKTDTREWTTTMGPEFGNYNGKVIKFKVEILDVKTVPVPPVQASVEAPVEAIAAPVVSEPEIIKEN